MPVRYADLPNIFLAAENIKQSKQQRRLADLKMQQVRQDQMRREALRAAQREAVLGNIAPFQMQFPVEFQQFQDAQQKALAEQEKMQIAQQRAIDERQKMRLEAAGMAQTQLAQAQKLDTERKGRTVHTIMGALNAAQQDPKQWSRIKERIQLGVNQGTLDPNMSQLVLGTPDIPDPALIEHTKQSVMQTLPMLAPPTEPTDDMIAIAQQLGIAPAMVPYHPEGAKMLAEARAAELEKRRKSLVNLSVAQEVPGEPSETKLHESVMKKAQTDLIEAEPMIQDLRKVYNMGKEAGGFANFLGAGPTVKSALLGGLDWLTSGLALTKGAKEYLAKKTLFDAIIQKIKSGELRKVLGATQSASELENMAGTLPETSVGPTVFGPIMDDYMEKVIAAIDMNRELVGSGKLEVGTPEFRDASNERWMAIKTAKKWGGTGGGLAGLGEMSPLKELPVREITPKGPSIVLEPITLPAPKRKRKRKKPAITLEPIELSTSKKQKRRPGKKKRKAARILEPIDIAVDKALKEAGLLE